MEPKYVLTFQTTNGNTIHQPISHYWIGSKRVIFYLGEAQYRGEIITPNVIYWMIMPYDEHWIKEHGGIGGNDGTAKEVARGTAKGGKKSPKPEEWVAEIVEEAIRTG
jgi:hypothetical protein